MRDPSDRIFMTALVKHTLIALALIVPITTISALADVTDVPYISNDTSQNTSKGTLLVAPSSHCK